MALGKYNRRTVMADTGAVISGATVTFYNQLTGLPVTAYDDPDGIYPLGSSIVSGDDGEVEVFLPPGKYRITTELGSYSDEITYEPVVGDLAVLELTDITNGLFLLDAPAETSFIRVFANGYSDLRTTVQFKTDLGLENVNNTSDVNKPISTATQTALDLKADLTDPRFTDAREWTASTITQTEAETGTATTRRAWTAQRVFQAIAAWWNASSAKTKLDGIATGAEVNQNAFSTISVAGQSDVIADSKTDAVTFVGGTGVNISTDPVTDTITFEATGVGTGIIEEVIAGSGLIGGGTTSTVTLNVGAGTGITVAADTVGLDTTNTRNVDHSAVSITAGTGLTGGGDLTATRTLNVSYGTTAGTAAQGNDSRLSDSREWTASTVTQAEAEAGTATTRRAFTAQRVRQAIVAWWNGSAEKTKLDGIATGATANQSDAYLLNRANHTGTQTLATISDAGTAAAATLTTSDTDTTTGRVLKVGDQEIGTRRKHIGSITTITPQWYSICAISSYGTKTTINIYGGRYGSSGRGDYTILTIGGASNSDANKMIAYRITNGNPPFVSYRIVGDTLYALGGDSTSYAYIEAISTSTVVTPTLSATTDPGGTDCTIISTFNTDNVIPVANGGTGATSASAARTNLELGTAATAALTTSTTDYTAGRVMRVGDFGVGVPPAVVSAPDWNTFTSPGFYRINGIGTNGPLSSVGTAADWNLLVMGNAAGALTQFAFSADVYQYVATRNQMSSGAWTSWCNFQFFVTSYTGNRVALTSSDGAITESPVTNVELGYLAGVTSQVSYQVAVPATPTSSGVAGTWAADATHLYHCYATNTWRRVAHSTW